MTVYSRLAINEPTQLNTTVVWTNNLPNQAVWLWNLGLLGVALAAFLVYIFMSNNIISQKYSQDLLRRQLNKANISLELENSTRENQISIESMYSYAQKAGIIEAKETESVFASGNEDTGFALTHNGN